MEHDDTTSFNDLQIDSFLSYIGRVIGYSDKTVLSYGHDLERLSVFLDKRSMKCTEMTGEDAREFTLELYDLKLSGATINRILSAIRRFYRHLCENGLTDSQPFTRISRAKQGRRIPVVLAPQEVLSLLEYPGDDYTQIMEVTMFNIFYSTGCRLSEVMDMKVSDIDFDQCQAVVTGKGSKQRYVFLSQRCISHLKVYIDKRNENLETLGIQSDALLLNKKGKVLPLSTVHSIFDKYRIRLGLSKKFTPHVFRHSFATHLLDNGSDIRVVQALLGHENIGTTQIYTHVTDSRLEEVYRNAHPHGRKKT